MLAVRFSNVDFREHVAATFPYSVTAMISAHRPGMKDCRIFLNCGDLCNSEAILGEKVKITRPHQS